MHTSAPPCLDAGTRPGAVVREPATDVRAVAVVLHGGKVASQRVSRTRHLSGVRMWSFASALARAGGEGGVAVWSVRYRVRGWNAELASPVADGRQVLDEVRRRYGQVPVVLVGHSMGGRAALRLSSEPGVAGVVALAPWLPPEEPMSVRPGQKLRIVHGDKDSWTDPRASVAYAERAATTGVDSTCLLLRGCGHPMLHRAGLWHGLAAYFAMECLNERLPTPQRL